MRQFSTRMVFKQKGVTLISVLIILTVITLLGITSMRMGLSSLNLATNSQVSQLLFQQADFGTASVANVIMADPVAAFSPGGVAGDTAGGETTYCVTAVATANFGSALTTGACNLNDASSFISDRKVVATEVTTTRLQAISYGTNSGANVLTQIGSGAAPLSDQRLKTHSTSVTPSFGSATIDQINGCLATTVPSDDEEEENSTNVTKTDCLTNVGAVFTTHVSEYNIVR